MKVKTTSINRNKISWLLNQELDVKMQALQHHLDLSRMLMNDVLEDESGSIRVSVTRMISPIMANTVVGATTGAV